MISIYRQTGKKCIWTTYELNSNGKKDDLNHWCCLANIRCDMWQTDSHMAHSWSMKKERGLDKSLFFFFLFCSVFLWTTQTACNKLRKAWVRHMSYSWDQLYAPLNRAQRVMWADFWVRPYIKSHNWFPLFLNQPACFFLLLFGAISGANTNIARGPLYY